MYLLALEEELLPFLKTTKAIKSVKLCVSSLRAPLPLTKIWLTGKHSNNTGSLVRHARQSECTYNDVRNC